MMLKIDMRTYCLVARPSAKYVQMGNVIILGGAEPNEYAYNGPDPVHNEELRLGKRV